MFPFDLQARFAKAWLDMAAAGMAAWSDAALARSGSAGSLSSRSWSVFPASTWATVWPWAVFTGVPSYGAAWGVPAAFSGAEYWGRTLGLGSTFTSWPFLTAPYTASYPAWDFLAAFRAPLPRDAIMLWSWPLKQMESGWPVIASYRNASGHATSMLLRGFDFAPSQSFYAWPDLSRAFGRR